MIQELTAGAASFVFVFLKAFQQRNVAFDNYGWVMPISLLMAAAEVYVIATVAVGGWHLFLVGAIGAGAGAGCLCAMYLHKRYVLHEKSGLRSGTHDHQD